MRCLRDDSRKGNDALKAGSAVRTSSEVRETRTAQPPGHAMNQRFFCASATWGATLIGVEPKGVEAGAVFFACLGFLTSRLLRS